MALQIGFIGAGSAAWRHSEILRDIESVQITAFCDVNPSKSSALAARFGAQAFTSAERMFRASKFDAIYFCLPANAHGAPENLAIKNGCALFIEPPIAAHIRTATTISNSIRKNGALVCVGSAWRYSDALERAKKILRTRRPVSSSLINALWQSEVPVDNGSNADALWLEAWPLLDQLRLLNGEPKRLIGLSESEKNAGGLLVENKTAPFANMNAFRLLHQTTKREANERAQIHIIRAEEELKLNFARETFNGGTLSLEWRNGHETLQLESGQHLDTLQNLAFLRAVADGKRTEIRCNYSEAIKTLKFALAAGRATGSAKFLEV